MLHVREKEANEIREKTKEAIMLYIRCLLSALVEGGEKGEEKKKGR